VKHSLPDCRIVLGGHHPTVLPEAVLGCRDVDYVIRGEGESAMPLLAKAIQTGKGFDSIPGLCFREPNLGLHIREPAIMTDLDAAPLPALDRVNHGFYRRGSRSSVVVTASRGCPMTCSYCCLGAASPVPYRRRSVSSVVAEIETAVRQYNAGFIDFEDENLSLEREWFLRLLKEITHRFGHQPLELRAMNGLFPPSLDGQIMGSMKHAGFKTLNLSLGSVSRAQMKRFHRPDVRNAFENVVRSAARHGLEVVGYIIVGAPDQQAQESLADLLFLASLHILAGVSVFYPAPGSADYGRCKQMHLLPENYSLMRASALPLSHTTTRLETVTLLRLARVLNFMKCLRDKGLPLPTPRPWEEKRMDVGQDRIEIGRHLLSGFLYDGIIRGVLPDGTIYDHDVSIELTQLLRQRLEEMGDWTSKQNYPY
jgi:anaerobic magnesium-protoporphyrin IX monomethyl ester cyclase